MQFKTQKSKFDVENTCSTFFKAVTWHKAQFGQFKYDLESYLFLDGLNEEYGLIDCLPPLILPTHIEIGKD